MELFPVAPQSSMLAEHVVTEDWVAQCFAMGVYRPLLDVALCSFARFRNMKVEEIVNSWNVQLDQDATTFTNEAVKVGCVATGRVTPRFGGGVLPSG